MDGKSAVEFPSRTRVHVALRTARLKESISFYERLFGQKPTKLRRGYAKFEVVEPAVNLTLNEAFDVQHDGGPISHFGIQVKSTAEVNDAHERLKTAGLETRVEEQTACCYAVQDKVWVRDPDGNEWEVFVVLEADVPTSPCPCEETR
jgi:catechol 2,3-dioxygenase-like lactoylglutathione lyase family enzyme